MWKLISPPSLSSAESSLEPCPRLESHLWLRASAHSAQKLYPSFFLCLPIRFQPTLLCVLCTCVCTHARIPKGCITLEVADRYLYSHDSRYTDSHLPSSTRERERERGFFIKARRSDQNMSLYQPRPFCPLYPPNGVPWSYIEKKRLIVVTSVCASFALCCLFLNFSFLFFNLVALWYSLFLYIFFSLRSKRTNNFDFAPLDWF